MIYTVVVPRPIRDDIASWGLPRRLLLEVYNTLSIDLPGRVDSLPRMAAPSPTFIFSFDLPHEHETGQSHYFTFWFTYGQREDAVYVRQCHHSVDLTEDPEHGEEDE
jgi:hypothetical protein